jgi:hypothetical protein
VSVYDLYQSYLNQAKASPVMASPVVDPSYLLYLQQQQRGGDGQGQDYDPTKDTTPTANLGITSLSDIMGLARDNFGTIASSALFGLGPTMIGKGIGALIGNIRDPNTDIFGRLNEVGLAAQAQNMAQARGITKGLDADAAAQGITGFTGYGTSKERGAAMHGGGNGGDHDGGASAGAQSDAAAGMGGY